MSNKKLLLGSDYDGTFNRNCDFPVAADIEAVREFRRRGNIFGIVTGRVPAQIVDIFDKLEGVLDFLLCSTGGVCIMPDKSIAFTSETTTEDIPELHRICREIGSWHTQSDAMSLTDGYATAEELYRAFPVGENEERFYINGYVDSFTHCSFVKPEAMKGIRRFTQFTSYFHSYENCGRAIETIEAAFPGKYKCHCLGSGFDMTPASVSKADGLDRVAAHFGIEHDNIYAVGDGRNDVSMLKEYHGIAMSGTVQDVTDAAEWVYDTVGEAVYGCLLGAK